jgi:hypothetical protein
MQTGAQADMTKLITAFCNFAKTPKNDARHAAREMTTDTFFIRKSLLKAAPYINHRATITENTAVSCKKLYEAERWVELRSGAHAMTGFNKLHSTFGLYYQTCL